MPDPRKAPLDRIFAVLEAVATAVRPVTISEISVMTGIAVSSTHRLVTQLLDRRMVRRYLTTKKIVTGPRLASLSVETLRTQMYADKPHAILKSLAMEVDAFALTGIVADGELVCIDSASTRRSSGVHFETGVRAPLHCTSIGKLYLAQLSDDEFAEWQDIAVLKRFSVRTITDPSQLKRECQEIRVRGWASCNEEYNPGVVGCAVPLPLAGASRFIGLCISAPSSRLDYGSVVRYAARLRRIAGEIAIAFEWHQVC
jgi:IclR family acetate operon transcriptional repressor